GLSVYLSIDRGLAAHEQPLRAAALGLLIGMGGGLGMSLVYLYGRLRATLPFLSLLRVGVAVLVSLSLGLFWRAAGSKGLLGSKVGTLISSGAALIIYLGVLFATRELSVAEVLSLRRQRPKGPAADAV